MQVISVRGDSWKPSWEEKRCGKVARAGCFPAAAGGGCYSVLLGDLARVRRLGGVILQLPAMLAQLLPRHSGHGPEVFAVTLFSGCRGGECRDVREGCVHISVLFICFFIQTFVSHQSS